MCVSISFHNMSHDNHFLNLYVQTITVFYISTVFGIRFNINTFTVYKSSISYNCDAPE